MALTYEELKGKTVQELRDIAKDIQHESVQGFSQMNKEHLLPALCKALGLDMHEHHQAIGIDKAALKARIQQLKKDRKMALDAHDSSSLKDIRRHIHRLNRQIRAHLS